MIRDSMSQKERSSLPPQVPEALIQAVLVGRDHTAPQAQPVLVPPPLPGDNPNSQMLLLPHYWKGSFHHVYDSAN